MANPIKIGLADNNKELCTALSEHIALQPDMKLVGVAYNGLAAMDLISLNELDILILDITMPYLDGIGVLEKLNRMPNAKRPRIIVITAIEQETMVKKLFGLGIDYYLIKPFTVETLLERIRQFGSSGAIRQSGEKSQETVVPFKNERVDIDARIANIFHEMGIPVNLRGYTYLREAVCLMLESNQNWSVTKVLYPKIAEKYHCSPSGVESAIRYILDMLWERGNLEYLSKFFKLANGSTPKQPTTSQFLTKIVEYIKIAEYTAGRK